MLRKLRFRPPLILIVTNSCNLRCSYCGVEKLDNFIDRGIAFKAVDLYLDLLGYSIGKIKLFGGEVFLRVDLLKEIISYIRGKSLRVEIEVTSNGLFLSESIIFWLIKNDVKLFLSLDGDKEAQLLNKKGMTSAGCKRVVSFAKKFFKEITVNMVVAPNTVLSFFKNFIYLYSLGIRKFNFLPVAYTCHWPVLKLESLRKQFNLIHFFILQHPGVYVKNVEINKKVPLFNSGIVIDYSGNIFLSDLIVMKYFKSCKDALSLGNVRDINSLMDKSLDFSKKEEATRRALQTLVSSRMIKSNLDSDRELSIFGEKIMEARKR